MILKLSQISKGIRKQYSLRAAQRESEESVSMHLIERHVNNLMNIGHFSLVLSQTFRL